MTEQVQEETKATDKELNFRKLEAKFEKENEQIRKENEELRKQLEELNTRVASSDDDDDDDPYIDKKKLQKWDQQKSKEYQQQMKQTVQQALEEERQQNWMKQHSDFYEIMQHADKFAEKDSNLPKQSYVCLRDLKDRSSSTKRLKCWALIRLKRIKRWKTRSIIEKATTISQAAFLQDLTAKAPAFQETSKKRPMQK